MVFFVLTGFGDFAGVHENPTEHIVKDIEDFIRSRKKELPEEARILSCTPLKVSAIFVDDWLTQTAERVQRELPSTAEVLWVRIDLYIIVESTIPVYRLHGDTQHCWGHV